MTQQAKEEAKEKLARYAPELATVKMDLESTQKYIQTLENRLSSSDAVIEGKNAELNAKELALYEERSKVMQLEYQQKKLIQLLERIPHVNTTIQASFKVCHIGLPGIQNALIVQAGRLLAV